MSSPEIINQRTELVAVSRLQTHPRNPRQGDVGAVHESITENGFYGTIVAQRSTGYVLVGNHRLIAAQQAGLRKIPVTWLEVDDERALRILLVDNRTSDLATYDTFGLAELLRDLYSSDMGLSGTGFDGDDLDDLVRGLELDSGQEPAPDPRFERAEQLRRRWKVKQGDVWQIGDHRLVCGDCTKKGAIQDVLDGSPAQMVMADPPYNVSYTGGSGNARARSDSYEDDRDDYRDWLSTVLTRAAEGSDDRAALHLWFASAKMRDVLAALDEAGWQDRNLLIWNKLDAHYGALSAQYKHRHEPMIYCHKRGQTPRWYGATNETTVWDHPQPHVNDLHPTMKPVELYERSIRNHTRPGAAVLELFSGSGTTLVACQLQGRSGRAVELDPKFAAVALERLSEMGLEPTKL
jgi:site-specific DNA-methyltransferase (adenine-specific)